MNRQERIEKLKTGFRYGVLGVVLAVATVVFVGLFLQACAMDNPRLNRVDTYQSGMVRPFGEIRLEIHDGLFTATTVDGGHAVVILPAMANSDGSPSAFALGDDLE